MQIDLRGLDHEIVVIEFEGEFAIVDRAGLLSLHGEDDAIGLGIAQRIFLAHLHLPIPHIHVSRAFQGEGKIALAIDGNQIEFNVSRVHVDAVRGMLEFPKMGFDAENGVACRAFRNRFRFRPDFLEGDVERGQNLVSGAFEIRCPVVIVITVICIRQLGTREVVGRSVEGKRYGDAFVLYDKPPPSSFSP